MYFISIRDKAESRMKVIKYSLNSIDVQSLDIRFTVYKMERSGAVVRPLACGAKVPGFKYRQ